jgi:hypothetical protein
LIFADGTCHTLGWEEIVTPASSDKPEANPLVEAWDKAGPKQRNDFVLARKVEITKAQHQIGWIAHGDIPPCAPTAAANDGLDLPDSLRRAPAAARNIDGWQEVEPGIFEKVIDGKAERSATFHPDLPEKDVAEVLRGYETQLMEPVHQRALDQWTAENGWRLTPTEAGGHVWRKVIDGKPYGIGLVVFDTADIPQALADAEKRERTRRKVAATREANKRASKDVAA